MKQKSTYSRRSFLVVQGGRNSAALNDLTLSRLLERADIAAHQWYNGEIGPKGQLRLIEAFRERMPGLSDELIQICGPAMLQAIVGKTGDGELDPEVVAFLADILEPPRSQKSMAEEEGFGGELQRIRAELALISNNSGLHVNQDAGYIDIYGEPRMPSGVEEGEGGELRPTYRPHHRIARIQLDGSNT